MARFLIDAQLPPALVRWLEERGHDAEHVADLGMLQASDQEIWRHAGAISAAVVTKDEGFVTLLSVRSNGAAVVWVRVGNTSRQALLTWFARLLPEIERALKAGENLIEVVG